MYLIIMLHVLHIFSRTQRDVGIYLRSHIWRMYAINKQFKENQPLWNFGLHVFIYAHIIGLINVLQHALQWPQKTGVRNISRTSFVPPFQFMLTYFGIGDPINLFMKLDVHEINEKLIEFGFRNVLKYSLIATNYEYVKDLIVL